MKKWQWILLAALTYMAFLVIYMPAIYVTSYIQNNNQNSIRLTGVSGSVFAGSADALAYSGMQINGVKWELSPLSLLMLRVNVDVEGGSIRSVDEIYIDGNLTLSVLKPQNIKLQDARALVPAKSVLAQVDLPVAITASGRFRVDIDELQFENGCQQLSGKGSWLQAAINIEGRALDLGAFNALLSCEAPAFAMQVAPDNGLTLDAKITVQLDGKHAANGTFTIPANFPNELKQGAMFFGESLGEGRYKLDIRSR